MTDTQWGRGIHDRSLKEEICEIGRRGWILEADKVGLIGLVFVPIDEIGECPADINANPKHDQAPR
ncbi:MAG: hypothetical protein MK004_09065, partial [Planctomycetales bacterium]|nr:hypothetical protein [Planctomycetales bacterium]